MMNNPTINAIENEINAPIDPRIKNIEKEPKIQTQKILKLSVERIKYFSQLEIQDHKKTINNGNP